MPKHRIPPKPPFYNSAEAGQCRYCGDYIEKNGRINRRANWHPACVAEYKILYWPKETRKAVWRRDYGHCAVCRTTCSENEWHMDHIIPLVEGDGSLTYWKLQNLQTLCIPCHKSKTSAEATARAEKRRQGNDVSDGGSTDDPNG